MPDFMKIPIFHLLSEIRCPVLHYGTNGYPINGLYCMRKWARTLNTVADASQLSDPKNFGKADVKIVLMINYLRRFCCQQIL